MSKFILMGVAALTASSLAGGVGSRFAFTNATHQPRGNYLPRFFHEKHDDDDGDTAILEAVQGVRKHVDQKFEDLDKSTKKSVEELTIAKNEFQGLASDFQTIMAKMKQLEGQLANERRMAFGNPIERITQNEEKCCLFNALVRRGLAAKYPEVKFNSDHRKSLENFDARIKALESGSTPGSTFINATLDREVYDVLAMYGIWNTFEVRPLSSRQHKMPVKTARAVATYIGLAAGGTEGGAMSGDSTKAGTSVTATVATAGVLLSVSEELLQDSEIDVAADVLDDFSQAIAAKMDWACLQADGGGDATDGGFTGIFGGGGTAVNAASGNTTMETLDFEDVTGVVIAAAAIANRGLKWWMHPAILTRFLHIKDGNNRPIFLTALEAPAPGNIGSILGYPVVPCHNAPSTNSASAKVAVLGDPRGLRVGVRKDFEFKRSDEVGFDEYAIYFRGISRHAVKIKAATAFRVLTLAAS
jgi:HK97 family phage major capsid protein